jgi:inhibitor of growth protein 3
MSEFHNTLYALTLLSEYTHTLDSLPIDLSRNFADLRELDAVLSSSIQSITAKIYNLISMIEEDKTTNEDRLWLLSDIAEEAQRLKLGGEDKIRVACQGADNLKAHAGHLRALTEHHTGLRSAGSR